MHILYAMIGYKPAFRFGGPVISVSAAAEALVRKGHQVTVVATNGNLDEDIDVPLDQPVDVDGVTVWYFRREEPLRRYLPFVPYLSQSMGYVYAPAMKRALERIVPDVDVVDRQMPFVYSTYAVSRAALRHGKPLFYHQRGSFLPSHLNRRALKKRLFLELFEKPVIRRATTLIALTEEERAAFRAISPQSKCEVIPNGVDVPPIVEGARERASVRYGIASDALVILFMSRLHPWKGPDTLLKAFSQIHQRHPNAVLLMAGPDEWDVQARWTPIAESGGFRSRLVFAGTVTGAEKIDLLARADLFCLPSRGEGVSMAVLEALASGTAVMLSPGCNMNEVEPAGAGLIVEADAEVMAHALADLLSDRERLRQMGEAGRRLVVEKYSWDLVTDRLVATYEEGIARSRAAALR